MIFKVSSRTIHIDIPKMEAVKLVAFKFLYIGYMILLPMYCLPFGWSVVLLAFILNHFVIYFFHNASRRSNTLSDDERQWTNQRIVADESNQKF
jgi:hypothetical protein